MPGATSSHSGSAQRCGRWQHRLLARLGRDALREAFPERCRRAQHVGRPGDEGVDDRTQRLHLLPAFRTPGDMRLRRRPPRSDGRACRAYRNTQLRVVLPVLVRCWTHGSFTVFGERLPELRQSGADSRLDRSERLIQPCRHLVIRQLGKECGLDRLSLLRREDRQGLSQEAALLLEVEGLMGITRRRRRERVVRMLVDALLPLLEPQPVDRSGSRLVHDPSDDGSARSIVRRRSSPHVVKHVERQLFGGFPVVGDPHDQGEHDSMRPFVQRMQRTLIARGDGLDEPDPVLLGYRSLRLVGIEQDRRGSRFGPSCGSWCSWSADRHDAES